jgi:hypothetical protein
VTRKQIFSTGDFQTMFHFPETETGYYEDEYSFFAHDREML